jgi:putative endonuclease
MHFVYILQIKKSGRYYVGQTQDLAKRLQKHSRGETKSMKNRGAFNVVYVEGCPSRAQALKREKQIKSYKGGNAFKRLLEGCDKQTKTIAELAEVPPKAG